MNLGDAQRFFDFKNMVQFENLSKRQFIKKGILKFIQITFYSF